MTNVNEFTNLGISNFAFIFTIINTILLCYFFYKTDMNIVKGLFPFFREHEICKKFHNKDVTFFWYYLASGIIGIFSLLFVCIATVTFNISSTLFFTLVLIASIIFSFYFLYKIYSKVFDNYKMRKSYGLFFVIPGISIIGWYLLFLKVKDKNLLQNLTKKSTKK